MSTIFTAPIYKLEELNNIFIELTAQNCNQRCQNCYIKLPLSTKPVKDFIPIDKIKEMFEDIKHENIHCIYLTGAEPMTHPDFNAILRLCLKKHNVCICTNGSFLNEKKIRFLKKVEDEGNHQIFFKLSLSHFEEIDNDKIKYRGHYRQVIFALKTLSRYNFTSVLSFQNSYRLEQNIINLKINELFKEQEIYNTDLQIICSHPDFEEKNFTLTSHKTDCMYSRTLGLNGIYTCPFLSNDYRGRVGSSFKNYSKTVIAETDFCATCSKNNDFIFTIG